MLNYLALEIRRSLRDRRYLLLVAGWPVAAYLLFSTVFGSSAAMRCHCIPACRAALRSSRPFRSLETAPRRR